MQDVARCCADLELAECKVNNAIRIYSVHQEQHGANHMLIICKHPRKCLTLLPLSMYIHVEETAFISQDQKTLH